MESLCIFNFSFFLALLLDLVTPVSAFDGGDAAALVLGLLIGIIGIFACLGCYARRKAGQMQQWTHLLQNFNTTLFILIIRNQYELFRMQDCVDPMILSRSGKLIKISIHLLQLFNELHNKATAAYSFYTTDHTAALRNLSSLLLLHIHTCIIRNTNWKEDCDLVCCIKHNA